MKKRITKQIFPLLVLRMTKLGVTEVGWQGRQKSTFSSGSETSDNSCSSSESRNSADGLSSDSDSDCSDSDCIVTVELRVIEGASTMLKSR